MPYRIGSEINTFNLAGVNLKENIKNFDITSNADELDASTLTTLADRAQNGQAQISLDFSTLSAVGTGTLCPVKVSSIQLTALGVGGTSYLTTFKSLNFNLDTTQVDVSAGADTMKSVQTAGYKATVDCTAMVPTGASHNWFGYINQANPIRQATFTMTLNGTVITGPFTILESKYGNKGKDVTEIMIKMSGTPACGVGNTFFSAPTSGTDLLTGFLVDPATAVNFEYSSNASNGEVLDVNMVLSSLSFSVERNTLVETNYSLKSTGNPSGTIS